MSAVGSFAGAPYLDAWSTNLQDDTLQLAEAGLIDSVEYIQDDKIFIFQGILDTIVPLGMYIYLLIQVILLVTILISSGNKDQEFL